MKRFGVLLATAALGAALAASGPAWARGGGGGGGGHMFAGRSVATGNFNRSFGGGGGWDWDDAYYGYGYPDYAYDYGDPGYDYSYDSTAASPLVTGRSVATGHMGNYCTTPVKNCELYHASYVGGGCSCRVPGGRARGSVTP
jgi:hypothetical protein